MLTPLSNPPYYAVIFTSLRTGDEGYAATAARMEELAQKQPGYLGIDSARSDIGITVSYWRDLASIRDWKQQWEHLLAQARGRTEWYAQYTVRVCLVEREYEFAHE